MKLSCKTVQDALATDGPQALRDDQSAQQHVAECDECFGVLESLSEIESGLHGLSRFDASDELVENLLARPEIVSGLATSREPSGWDRLVAAAVEMCRPRPLVWGSLATVFMVVAFALVMRSELRESATSHIEIAKYAPPPPIEDEIRRELESQGSFGGTDSERLPKDGKERAGGEELYRKEADLVLPLSVPVNEGVNPVDEPFAGQDKRDVEVQKNAELEERVVATREVIDPENLKQTRFSDDFISDLPVPGRNYQNVLSPAPGVQDPDGDDDPTVHGSRSRDLEAQDRVDGASRSNANSIEEMEVAAERRAQSDLADVSEENRRKAERKGNKSAPKAKRPLPLPPAPKPLSDLAPGPTSRPGVDGVTKPVLIETSRVDPTMPEAANGRQIAARVVLQVIVRANGTLDDLTVLNCTRPGLGFEQAAIDAVSQWRFEAARQAGKPVDVYWTVRIDFDPSEQTPGNRGSQLETDEAVRTARRFLDQRNTTDGLTFKPATGYWSTTYVPGDPAMRLLQSRLAGWDPSVMQAFGPSAPQLHDASRQVGQPFDTPDSSALAVYLHTDRRGLIEAGRMLVQVGLEGTPRHGGFRPAMNLALVLDLRDGVAPDVAIGIRSLLEAFNRAKEPGDSFRVFVAGRPGGCVVEPDDFRHGYLKVMLERLIEGSAAPGPGLVDAVSSAIATIATPAESEMPLGSNAVVLITGSSLGDATRSLADLAHQGAVAGVPLSVIGIGSGVDLPEIDFVTLAGQGTRRLLDDAATAAELVDRELASASRAIARAVRLRIRLAPGVKLVDVIGSRQLDASGARKVREAERSIDLRLARKLGIEADRGEDEEGIQIVIPNFYAGDSHAILLDVVVPGPGPVADVTMRYKDLVHLRNGVARASLNLERNLLPAGPLERNVLKNLLSMRLSRTLDNAGQALKSGEAARATVLLHDFQALLEGLRRDVPGLDNDPDLLRDIAMLGEYRTLLAGSLAGRPDQIAYISDSLRYAARLKVLPRPLETRS